MLLAFIMLFVWQATNDQKYQTPFDKSVEAEYENSEAKRDVEAVKDKMKRDYPVPTAVLPIGYSVGVRRQVSFHSQSVTPVPGALANYNLNYQTKTYGLALTWRF